MSHLILTRGAPVRKKFLSKIFRKIEFGPYFLLASLIIFVALVTVLTLRFSTQHITKGYVLIQLESQNNQLIRESERRQMQISTVRSLQYIENSNKVRSMVNPRNIVFMEEESAIAKN